MPNRKPPSAVAGFAATVLILAGCAQEPEVSSTEPPASAPVETSEDAVLPDEPEVFASGLDAPWSIAFFDETPLVSERDSGRILALDAGGNASEVATIDDVDGSAEGGLLGITIYERFLYVYFTAGDENRIQRYAVEGDGVDVSLGDPEVILGGIPASGHHNGGRIAFGPDGMLYATAGDTLSTQLAQDPDSLAGKILRMTPEGDVPEDNPFSGSYVFSLGHRNPQGLAWADDGTLYASEFGQDTWDEFNLIEAGGNYGWPEVEGIADHSGLTDPLQQWEPADASPSGIAIHNDVVYIANLRGERLRSIPLSDPDTSTEHFIGVYGRLRDVVVGPDGALWILTNNTDGRGNPSDDDDRILRVTPQE